MGPDYHAPRYWEGVYDAAYDESAVGYPNLARSINRARYDVERRNVERALAVANVANPRRVLDVGSGTGIWVEFWSAHGANEIVGADLAAAAVTRLQERYPRHEFLQRDISDADPSLPGDMDVVSAMSVLLHITNDTKFERALENLLRCVGANGALVLVEPAVVHRWWGPPFGPEANSKARPLTTYQRVMNRAGFEIVVLRPAAILLANAVDTRWRLTFRLLDRYWNLLSLGVGRRERLGRTIGGILRTVDIAGTRLATTGPSAKVIVARRSAPGRDSARRRVVLVPEWYPSREHAYEGSFVRDQALAAARANDLTVVVQDSQRRRGDAPAILSGVDDTLKVVRIRTRSRRGSTAARLEFLIAIARLLRRMQRDGKAPDLLHAHVFSSGLLALLGSRGRYPVILSEHNSDFLDQTIDGRDRWIARFVLRRADLVCPVSARLAAALEELEPAGRYEVVPNVVDLEAFEAISHPARGESPPRLLVVATLATQKGIEYLLEALAHVQYTRTDFALDIVGDGPLRQELERMASARLAPGLATFHGSRTRAEIAAFMAQANVFVLPSVVETFGVAAIEALASGLPVIITDVVPAAEVVDERFGIVVPPADTGALHDAVIAMLERPPTVPRDLALEIVRPFGAEEVGRRWDEVYRRVAREP